MTTNSVAKHKEIRNTPSNMSIHSSDMSIIQKFLINQIASDEFIIFMTPYCPTPQHLHMQEGVNLLNFNDFWWIKMSWIPKFSLKFLSGALVMWDDAQVSERWAIDERRGGGGYNTLSPILFYYPIFFKQSLTIKEHLFNIIYVVWTGWRIQTDKLS